MAFLTNYKRRIRVIGKPGETKGYTITVSDDETGEQITNVMAITIHIAANAVTTADVVYHDELERVHAVTLEEPNVDVCAMEVEADLKAAGAMFDSSPSLSDMLRLMGESEEGK